LEPRRAFEGLDVGVLLNRVQNLPALDISLRVVVRPEKPERDAAALVDEGVDRSGGVLM